MFNYIEQKMKT